MTTKNFLRIASFVMLLTIASTASAAIVVPESNATKTENIRANQLLQRLNDIKEMDKSEMTRMEKKNLRKEVVEIKKEMKTMSGGVYLSVGAIIIVILLLILLF